MFPRYQQIAVKRPAIVPRDILPKDPSRPGSGRAFSDTTRWRPLQLTLFPNPTTGPLTLLVEGTEHFYEVTVHDALGRLVYAYSRVEDHERFELKLDVTGWMPGHYLLTVRSGGQRRGTVQWVKL